MIEGHENIKPNLRVCILNWNGGDTLNQCVNSILSNNASNFRVTVIDNCSTDDSIEKLDSQIELIQLEKNYGFSAGYNLGLNRCLSDNDEYIILLNCQMISISWTIYPFIFLLFTFLYIHLVHL